MINTLLQIIAPDHCYGCNKISTSLCEDCKYDIISEPFDGCIWCRKPSPNAKVCQSCDEMINTAWAIGERSDVLRKMIDEYKFNHRRSLANAFAELLDELLPVLTADTVVCELPTVRAHIRQRSFDHTKLLAKQFASRRKLPYVSLLTRTNNERQYGSDQKTRHAQASRAFATTATADSVSDRPVLIIDDVLTTGASLHFAAKALHDGGIETIHAAIIARQPLDQTEKI